MSLIEEMDANLAEGNEGTAEGHESNAAVRRPEVVKCLTLRRLQEAISPDRAVALLLFLFLFAFSLTFTLSRYLEASSRFPDYVGSLSIIVMECIAIFVLLYMWFCARTQNTDKEIDTDLQPWHRLLRRNIRLFGIVPFYFAIFIYDFFHLTAVFKCRDAWSACSSSVVRQEHYVDMASPFVRSIYLFWEMLICIKFNRVNFFQKWMLFELAWIEATNLSGWVDALIDDLVIFSFHHNSTEELLRCFNRTDVNVSSHVVQCFSRTTDEYRLLASASPYLYPFIMEYLMLVMECVMDWFFNAKLRHDQTVLQTTRPTSMSPSTILLEQEGFPAAPTANNETDVKLVPTTSSGSRADERPRQEGASSSGIHSGSEQLQDDVALIDPEGPAAADGSRSGNQSRYPWVFISVIASSIVSTVFVILCIDNFLLDGYRDGFMGYRLGYWVVLFLAAITSICFFLRFLSAQIDPNGFEYFLTVTCIGAILQCVFTIVANVQTKDLMTPTVLILLEQIANILQISTQIIFYRFAKRIQIHADGDNDDELRRKRLILQCILACFVVCNFALWISDSFIETHSSANSWQNQYFYNWPAIYNICNPLAQMFRFNSALLFLDVLLEKRHK